MLNEPQILDRWQRLFRDKEKYEDDLRVADELLDQLADFSPVRQRLTQELSEIQSMHGSGSASSDVRA